MYFQNVAGGDVHIGQQIAHNTGTVTTGSAGPLDAELDRLRAALREAGLDRDVREEAERDIEAARTALAGADPAGTVLAGPDKNRAIRALRRLSGTLEGFAGLGALAGSVIAAVEGWPA
ncbi:hypothetical protein AB0C07_29355 [Actinoplanes missouriensis]|uniref:hypothetical protein n=1 Tax=Actinoplanes missouriensis TaxID=1866 RepID=UPI0033FE62B3